MMPSLRNSSTFISGERMSCHTHRLCLRPRVQSRGHVGKNSAQAAYLTRLVVNEHLPSTLKRAFSIRLVLVQVQHPCNRIWEGQGRQRGVRNIREKRINKNDLWQNNNPDQRTHMSLVRLFDLGLLSPFCLRRTSAMVPASTGATDDEFTVNG